MIDVSFQVTPAARFAARKLCMHASRLTLAPVVLLHVTFLGGLLGRGHRWYVSCVPSYTRRYAMLIMLMVNTLMVSHSIRSIPFKGGWATRSPLFVVARLLPFLPFQAKEIHNEHFILYDLTSPDFQKYIYGK